MNIAERISRLEAALKGTPLASAPVLLVTLAGEDSGPYVIEHEGRRWVQAEGEALDALQARAKAEALQGFTSPDRFPVLALVAQRCSGDAGSREKTSPALAQSVVDGTGD